MVLLKKFPCELSQKNPKIFPENCLKNPNGTFEGISMEVAENVFKQIAIRMAKEIRKGIVEKDSNGVVEEIFAEIPKEFQNF